MLHNEARKLILEGYDLAYKNTPFLNSIPYCLTNGVQFKIELERLLVQKTGSAGLTIAVDDVFIGAQLLQAHRAAGVELLGGNAHLTA